MKDARSAPANQELVAEAQVLHENSLMAYARSLLRDVERARDVVQDTCLKLHQQDPVTIQDTLKPWLFRVCRNRAFDVLKKERRMTSIDSQFLESIECDAPSPAQSAQRKETHEHLLDLVESLAPNQREVIRLRFQGDLSYQEIADITQLSVSKVGFLLHTALKNLRAQLTTA